MDVSPTPSLPSGRPAQRQARILVVDDDERLRGFIVRHLEQAGFQVIGVGDARQMARIIAREHFDLAVLDLMLPDADGLQLCASLRSRGWDTPVLILSARGEEMDRIMGLEMGADDYLPKPCSARELIARARAITRRAMPQPATLPSSQEGNYLFGRFELDYTRRCLRRDGEPVAISPGEFGLLAVLTRRPNRPLSRDQLSVLVNGKDYRPDERALDVRMSRLRRIIEEDPDHPRYLQTVWGVGYVFVADPA